MHLCTTSPLVKTVESGGIQMLELEVFSQHSGNKSLLMAGCQPVMTSPFLSSAFIVVYFSVVKMEAGRKPLTFTAEVKDFLRPDNLL